MPITRRQFIHGAAASAALIPLAVRAEQATPDPAQRLFRHGVASGDPLTDRVMLWTRVTPAPTRSATGPIDVQWQIATDEKLAQVVARGTAQAASERDFTVKVDAGNLQPGRPYYYAFTTGGERSPVGRTKTLPARADRLRFGSVSCSNYPAGYFNVYRCLANRPDLDAVLHLGDYIYEFANARYGDGSASGRVPLPAGEAYDARGLSQPLRDLSQRHRPAGRPPPAIRSSSSGTITSRPTTRGPVAPGITVRRTAIGPCGSPPHIARISSGCRSANHRKAASICIDRSGSATWPIWSCWTRVRCATSRCRGTTSRRSRDPKRSLLGAAQEAWLFDQLRASQRAGSRWRILGQQILFSTLSFPGLPVGNPDLWDGYPAARNRVFDLLASEKITDVAILTGDIHSSWAFDVPRNPFNGYDPTTGAGSVAVEFVTPAISSPPFFASAELRERAAKLRPLARHLKFLEGERNGYTLLDVTRDRIQAEWYHVPTVAAAIG